MKALFLTTKTVDCENHVRAWNSISREPAVHITYEHRGGGIRMDQKLFEQMQAAAPDVMFYIGANSAPGNPKPSTLRAMKSIAPFINLCSDAADRPWHNTLLNYRALGCFTLQVSIDGARIPQVDYATLTPVDAAPFANHLTRDIRCGFSGGVGKGSERSEIITALQWFKGLVVRPRDHSSYDEHAWFTKRCRMLLNFSWTGTAKAHHIKGRVLEAGFAGCALLEHENSPLAEWFPEECCIRWRDAKHIAELLEDLDDETITTSARRLSEEVWSRYGAARIYGDILKRAHVHRPKPRPAA